MPRFGMYTQSSPRVLSLLTSPTFTKLIASDLDLVSVWGSYMLNRLRNATVVLGSVAKSVSRQSC